MTLPRMYVLAAFATFAAGGCGSTLDYRIDVDGGTVSPLVPDQPCTPGSVGCLDAPRLVGPMSTATVTLSRPTLRWSLAAGLDGGRVEICRDRACSTVDQSLDVTGTRITPTFDLAPGVHYWRVTGRAGGHQTTPTSMVWEFFVGHRATAVDTAWGSVPDFNGDGYADVAAGAVGVNSGQGAAYVYYGSAHGIGTTPSVVFPGPDGMGSQSGRSVASAGDLDGDGFADLVVGAYGVAGDTGRAYVYYGSAAGLDPARRSTLVGMDGPNAHFGFLVAGAGDLDGDGYGDLAVGAYGAGMDTGRVYVFPGGSRGVTQSQHVVLDGPDGMGGLFGDAITGAGDVNGDGYADLVVGGLGIANQTGGAYVFPGGPMGVDPSRRTALTTSDGAGAWFGRWVSCLGDVNGDGYPDVAVAEDHVDGSQGKVWVYYGGAAGLADARRELLGGVAGAGAHFGNAVAGAGDVNGDGFEDLVVGAQTADMVVGRAYVYFGGPTGPGQASMVPAHNREPDVMLLGPDGNNGEYGRSVNGPGDVNGDGFADLLVSADQVGNNAGRVYVYFGSATLPGASPSRMELGRDPQTVLTAPAGDGGHFGWDLADRRGFVRGLSWGMSWGSPRRGRGYPSAMEL